MRYSILTLALLLAPVIPARAQVIRGLVWIAANCLSVGLLIYKGLYVTSGLYLVYQVLCILGWVAWRRALRAGVAAPGFFSCPFPFPFSLRFSPLSFRLLLRLMRTESMSTGAASSTAVLWSMPLNHSRIVSARPADRADMWFVTPSTPSFLHLSMIALLVTPSSLLSVWTRSLSDKIYLLDHPFVSDPLDRRRPHTGGRALDGDRAPSTPDTSGRSLCLTLPADNLRLDVGARLEGGVLDGLGRRGLPVLISPNPLTFKVFGTVASRRSASSPFR